MVGGAGPIPACWVTHTFEGYMGLASKIRKALGDAVAGASRGAHAPVAIPSGLAILDHALGGGFMEGRLIEIYGESTVGKSLLLDLMLIRTQQRGGVGMKFATEEAHNAKFFEELGGKPKDLLLYPNPESDEEVYIEDVVVTMDNAMVAKQKEKDDEPFMIGWDSIAATLPKAVLSKELEDADMKYNLARAQCMSNACPRLHTLARSTKTTIIATNQIRQSMDKFNHNPTRPGGASYPFYASQWLELRKGAAIKNDNNEAIGHWINGKVTKNRLDSALKPFRLAVYTRYDSPHPIYESPLKAGIHVEESLWEFCHGRKSSDDEAKSKVIPYFLLPDGKPVLELVEKGWFQMHPSYGGKKFRKSAWLEILEEQPTLKLLPAVPA